MKLVVLCVLCGIALAAPRQKRLTVGTIAVTGGVGGSTGCVVTAVKQALKERQESLKSRMAGKKEKAVTPKEEDLPKAPQKPSFCTEEDTTQFYF
ncbi:pepsin inhibitor-3-like repeated domain protein [Ostertagia ostertagi]